MTDPGRTWRSGSQGSTAGDGAVPPRGWPVLLIAPPVMFAALLVLPAVLPLRAATTATALGYLVCTVAALVLLVTRAVRAGLERVPWLLVAAGVSLVVLSQTIGSLTSDKGVLWGTDLSPPSGIRGSILALVAYPLLYAGQLALLRQRVRRVLPSAWLDGVLITTLLMAVVNGVVLPALPVAPGAESTAVFALAARVALDLLMLGFVITHARLVGWRVEPRLVLVVAGFTLLLLSDVATATVLGELVPAAGSHPVIAAFVATGRFTVVLLLAAAAWWPSECVGRTVMEGWVVMVAPAVGLLGALALLAWHLHSPLPVAAGFLALTTLVVIGIKIVLVFLEVLRLVGSRQQALTDDLTGLANRRALTEHLAMLTGSQDPARSAWRRSSVSREITPTTLGLLLIDLDHFKDVNDSLGHEQGDALLRQVALRMAGVVPDGILLARLGGDEFAVVLRGADASKAQDVAEHLLRALSTPFRLESVHAQIGASIGTATWPFRPETGPTPTVTTAVGVGAEAATELLRQADTAMYTAKRGGGGVAAYDEATGHDARRRLERVAELRAAIPAGELITYYQPQVDIRTGRVVGMEALVRWQHPERGLLAPAHFLDLAETHGMMAELTATVLRQAATEAVVWRDAGWPLRIAVNLTASCLLNSGLPLFLDEVLLETGLSASALVLEITETTLMRDPARSRATIDEFVARGVGVSIDDYGTGYSSLAYLQDLPAIELKLDQSFTGRLTSDARTAAIVAGTAELAHSLGLRLIVEGVDDDATLQRLADLDVDETQGFHHARPMPAPDVLGWLRRYADEGAARGGSPVTGKRRPTHRSIGV
ncbi:MAG: putative bifunctional diguanylate cyclase/phosphodiesterase [Janthinobacterium lividum]